MSDSTDIPSPLVQSTRSRLLIQSPVAMYAVAVSAPVLMSAAAAVTTFATSDGHVLVAAWVAVAIVGTASVISAAVTIQQCAGRADENN